MMCKYESIQGSLRIACYEARQREGYCRVHFTRVRLLKEGKLKI